MFKSVQNDVWAFDLEWVPDVSSGRRLYALGEDVPDAEVMERMWAEAGATNEDPRPYLKTVLCRIVSAAVVTRQTKRGGEVSLDVYSVPGLGEGAADEKELVSRFLEGVGKTRPQLVGFNVVNADLPILLQRAVALGISAPAFCSRPDKPWQGVDYFQRAGDWVVDLRDLLGGRGRAGSSLHELAVASRIPGKVDVNGAEVADLWLAGHVGEIVAYNQLDALSTYLLWLRTAHLAGFVTTDAMTREEELLESLLRDRAAKGERHFERYLEVWGCLRG